MITNDMVHGNGERGMTGIEMATLMIFGCAIVGLVLMVIVAGGTVDNVNAFIDTVNGLPY